MIKNHKELASFIAGKKILHLNRLGKDSAVVLEWLCRFARPEKVVALNFAFMSGNKYDKQYLKWQQQRYPEVEFISRPNPHELTNVVQGLFQDPIKQMNMLNSFEFNNFNIKFGWL